MRVLSEYEVGCSVAAILAVSLLDKPIAEVMTRHAEREDLEADLRACLAMAGHPGVSFWIRPVQDGPGTPPPWYRYGFYREPWTLDALDFLDRSELTDSDRAWIAGLLFGYRPAKIQEFITAKCTRR